MGRSGAGSGSGGHSSGGSFHPSGSSMGSSGGGHYHSSGSGGRSGRSSGNFYSSHSTPRSGGSSYSSGPRGGGYGGGPRPGYGPGPGGPGGPGYYGGGPGMPPPPPPRRHWWRRRYYDDYDYDYGYPRRHYRHRVTGGGCLTSILIAFLIVFFLVLAISADMVGPSMPMAGNGPTDSEVQVSTERREKLSKSNVNETAYFENDADWDLQEYDVNSGMQYFYDATGVQPYLIIADNLDGNSTPTTADMDTYLEKRYGELFTDEQHLLVLFFDNGTDWGTRFFVGNKAKVLMDSQACEILADYFDYYNGSDLTDTEYISTVFQDTADRIMSVTHDSGSSKSAIVVGIVIVLVIIFLIVLFRSIAKSKEAAAKLEEEREQNMQKAASASGTSGTAQAETAEQTETAQQTDSAQTSEEKSESDSGEN